MVFLIPTFERRPNGLYLTEIKHGLITHVLGTGVKCPETAVSISTHGFVIRWRKDKPRTEPIIRYAD